MTREPPCPTSSFIWTSSSASPFAASRATTGTSAQRVHRSARRKAALREVPRRSTGRGSPCRKGAAETPRFTQACAFPRRRRTFLLFSLIGTPQTLAQGSRYSPLCHKLNTTIDHNGQIDFIFSINYAQYKAMVIYAGPLTSRIFRGIFRGTTTGYFISFYASQGGPHAQNHKTADCRTGQERQSPG